MSETASDKLISALLRHGIQIDTDRSAVLERYCGLLWSWNKKLNLTRHTTFDKFATRDVVDSLALADCLQPAERVLDVGTGGGVPGIVLAILRPDLKISVCDSVGKKARAVEAMVAELGIPVTVYHARAEELLEWRTFDTLVARAVAGLPQMIGWLSPHWDVFDQLLMIKGRAWSEEYREARDRGLLKSLEVCTMSKYRTPGTDAQSVVVRMARS